MATRRFAAIGAGDGEGELCLLLLAAADMLLVSLFPRSIDRCLRVEWDLDLPGMMSIVPTPPAADDVPDVQRLFATAVLEAQWRRIATTRTGETRSNGRNNGMVHMRSSSRGKSKSKSKSRRGGRWVKV